MKKRRRAAATAIATSAVEGEATATATATCAAEAEAAAAATATVTVTAAAEAPATSAAAATADILPECAIHKILSSLSFKEAIQMSILSKLWLQASLTHPNLEFTVRFIDEHIIKIVDKIMDRYRDGRILIDKFEFHNIDVHDISHLIDKWLAIALQNGVKDILFSGYINSSYTFPVFKFLEANSLTELVLTRCKLRHLPLSVVTCHSLTKLSLTHVCLDDNMLQTLLTSCPFIVDLIIDDCNSLENIELLNLLRIRSLTLNINTPTLYRAITQLVDIQAPTLEHLSYSSSYSLEELDIVEYQNLKSLTISCDIWGGFLEDLISTTQFLESLILVSRASGSFNICRSQSLKVLKIANCQNIETIDAPNLVSFEYNGRGVPQFKFAKESSKLKHSHIILDFTYSTMGTVVLCKLKEFLSNSISWSQVSLNIGTCYDINRKDLQLHSRVATAQVDVLDVNITRARDCPLLVDALLWICHPRRLNLSSTVEITTCFIDRLMCMKTSSHSTSHGRKRRRKPQLSQLKEVQSYKFDWENECWHRVELRSGGLTTSNLQEREKFYFLLDW